MRPIVDTHCHIDAEVFDNDRAVVIDRALTARVPALVVIGYNPDRWRSSAALMGKYPFIRRTVGIHPNEASMWSDEVAAALDKELRTDSAIAIGEIGLDFYRDHASPERQRRAFRAQLELAIDRGLPVVIHQRNAEQEVLSILAEFADVKGVMHCFSGDPAFAEACLELGFYLGVGGVLTYPRSVDTREALRLVPLDRVIIETDSPYLAPQAWRGQRNEPAYARSTLEALASLRDVHEDVVADATTANAITLFGMSMESALIAGQEWSSC